MNIEELKERVNEYYFDGNKNYIILGDCNNILPLIETNSIDLMVTDPPYFIPSKHYSTRTFFKRNFGDLGILESFFKIFFREIERVLKPTGAFYMFCDGQSYPLFFYHSYFFTKRVRPVIWNKITSINGYTWRHQHEIILFGEMPECKHIPTGDGDIIKSRAVPVKKRTHAAEKPIEVLEKLILKSSKEGDYILDPFVGTGSVIKVCEKLNRNYISIELERTYFNLLMKDVKQIIKSE